VADTQKMKLVFFSLITLLLQGCFREFISLTGDSATNLASLTFVIQPLDQSAYDGEVVEFEALAEGVPEPNYQWEEWIEQDGKWRQIEGGTSTKLSFVANVGDGENRRFRCVAKSKFTSIDSNSVGLSFLVTQSQPIPPVNKTSPYLIGTAEVGNSLTVTPGEWDSEFPLVFKYRWYINDSWRSSVESETYVLGLDDEGASIKVEVVASNSDGSSSAWTQSLGPVAFDLRSKLFGNAEKGIYLPTINPSNLYRDVLAQEPVDSPGQSVALIYDTSRDLPLGPEKVTNGDFSVGTGWINGGGWSISGGELHAGNDGSLFSQNVGIEPNRAYLVQFTVIGRTQGHLGVMLGGYAHTGYRHVLYGNNGPHTAIYLARPGADGFLRLQVSNNWDGRVDNISIVEVPYNRLFQSGSTQRPIYGREPITGRRNILSDTEDFSHSNWQKTNVNMVTNQLAPDQTLTAVKLEATTHNATHQLYQMASVSNDVYSFSVYAKAAGEPTMAMYNSNLSIGQFFNLSTGNLSDPIGTPNGASMEDVGDGWYRCTVKILATEASFSWRIYVRTTQVYAGNNTDGILVWRPQLEKASEATSYQKVVSEFDVTEEGVDSLNYLSFDGVNDGLHAALMDGIDSQQLSVWTAIQKRSDLSAGLVAEFGQVGTDRRWAVYAPGPAGGYRMLYVGDNSSEIDVSTVDQQWNAPSKAVLTGSFDFLTSSLKLRANSADLDQNSSATAGGVFGETGLYIGRRSNNTEPLNAKIYSLIIRDKKTDTNTSNLVEQVLMRSMGLD
jgi:hypothetical protein